MKKSLQFLLSLVFLSTPLGAQIYDAYVIPAVANGDGARGTRWASEVHVFNPQPHHLNISFIFVPSGGTQAIEKVFKAEPNMTLYAENILGEVFGVEGTGALTISAFLQDNTHASQPIQRSFVAGSRVYNNASSGTYGQRINGEFDPLMDDGLTAIADGITNGTGTGFRANVGAVNLGRWSVRMLIHVYDADGDQVGNAIPFELPPMGHLQDALPVAIEHGVLEFSMVDADPEGASTVFPYVSVVDNLSGDAVYISPRLLATPTGLYCPTETGSAEILRGDGRISARSVDRASRTISAEDVEHLREWAVRLGHFETEGGRLARPVSR